MVQFIVTSASPKATATSQSSRVRPRSRGRAIATRTTALDARRSHTIAVGDTTSNRCLATAAPNCTDKIPVSTSHTGDSRGAGWGTGPI